MMPLQQVTNSFEPMFRLIPAQDYVDILRTDRRHMKVEGQWLSPPPPWEPIGEGSNLLELIDMSNKAYGDTVDLEALRRQFGIL